MKHEQSFGARGSETSAETAIEAALRGAYDAANVVIPVSSDFYYESRPSAGVRGQS